MRRIALAVLVVSAAVLPTASPVIASDPCPADMKLVDGEYCPNIQTTCLRWRAAPYTVVCEEYGLSTCLSPRKHKRYCMQEAEFSERDFALLQASSRAPKSVDRVVDPQSELPLANINYWQAKDICQTEGWRLCKETEFEFSCSGEEMRPYPQGWKRSCGEGSCNCDRTIDVGADFEHRVDHRVSPRETLGCISQSGIINLTGNTDEIYERDHSAGAYRDVLKGGHWIAGARNRCIDASTLVHNEYYSHITLSFRCCYDPKE